MLWRFTSALFLFAACSGPAASDDSGADRDASEEDVAADLAEEDASSDVREEDSRMVDVDAGDVPDGASTDPADPTDPSWVVMPGLPDRCQVERALHPERLSAPEWVRCGEGCEMLPPHATHVRSAQSTSGYHDGEHGYFFISAYALADERRRETWLMNEDGRVLAAWRAPPLQNPVWCGVQLAFGSGGAALTIRYFDSSPGSERSFFYFADAAELRDSVEPDVVIPTWGLPQQVGLVSASRSSQLYAAQLLPGGNLLLIRPDGTWERQNVQGEAQRPYVVGDTVVFVRAADEIGLATTRFGEEVQPLLEEPGAFLYGLSIDWAARQMLWIRTASEGAITDATSTDLYVADLPDEGAFDAATFRPQHVRNLFPEIADGPPGLRIIGGNGYYAYQGPTFFVSAVDPSRPAEARPTIEADLRGSSGPLWMANGYLYWASVYADATPAGLGATVVRTALDSLVPYVPR